MTLQKQNYRIYFLRKYRQN